MIKQIPPLLVILLFYTSLQGQTGIINSGIHWFDQNNKTVSAHGAGILKEKDTYYMFGEFKRDDSNAFNGFSCYSSKNLSNWTFENVVLPVQKTGKLAADRVGERPKVLRCPSTGEYIMYMHTDNLQYKDPVIGYATSDKIDGNYTFQGPLLFDGKPINRWDMGTFQDTDGSGYLIIHHGDLYKLSEDYKSIKEKVVSNATDCESPVIFKNDGTYYWLGSGLTGWERNDNFYYTADNLSGPWIPKGNFAPEGSLTWNSQSTFVLPVKGKEDTTYIYMGDRWSHPRQNSSATYVWQPLEINENTLSIPEYYQSWKINTKTGEWTTNCIEGQVIENTDSAITYLGEWSHYLVKDNASDSRSDEKGASLSYNFKGARIGIISRADSDGGYAKVTVKNKKGKIVVSTVIDMYCQYPETSIKFLSPLVDKGEYNLSISVLGEHWYWTEKTGKEWGSSGVFISIDKLIIQSDKRK